MPRLPINPNRFEPEKELIASFGGARIVKDLSNNLYLEGGSHEDRQAAREWANQFLHNNRRKGDWE